MRLKDKVAIVTGSAAGIGRGIVERFLREDAKVAIADINIEAARKTADELGRSTVAIKVDVTDRKSVEQMVVMAEEQLGPIDILVNNAGVSEIVPFLEMNDAMWDKHIDVNLKGAFLCAQAVLKNMVKRKAGKIINMSSQSGKKGNSQYEAYCASKFGIIGLTQSLAVEFAPFKINVNAVCPGVVWTPLWDKMAPQYAIKRNICVDHVRDYLANRIPLGRLCTPDDVAGVVAFLTSADADYMTGQAINITGGVIMH
ncbi:MAG: hypothetical protein A2Y12_18390 [Planctomycetes bacterium GWF2_42_9]|nr:MAG: hypothetical protein A2Y12_18390 [Planctomycetes bacterium GWF2_42_9]